ncbi:AimR family lysis-lysogeny pheromone receptor [Cytobacillus sp. IB215665]|uniref:AimR family lysis-lysogeny pheromone receptor n=1 Tax=Cytobacillus sp. IB215665 TaxID=3097357 RepID=UPI002A0C5B7E|nr:AimR family lysis-lysogeny pheromone receptor [Cytobacillus sp. IB215665]MDX8367879.1 AimR family lysis-lysogeny pheromone receptor [Cytobacillus sp. IB215665]
MDIELILLRVGIGLAFYILRGGGRTLTSNTKTKPNINRFGEVLNETIEKYNLVKQDIADFCNVDSSIFSKLKNGGESSFEKILRIVRRICVLTEPSKEKELMLIYIQGIRQPKNIKCAMEYSDTHNQLDESQMLCDKAFKLANWENKLDEFAELYSLRLKRKRNNIALEEWYEEIIKCKPKTDEMKTFRSLLIMLYYHDSGKYHKILDAVTEVRVSIEELETNYLRFSFGMRLNQRLQAVYLHNICDFEKARTLAIESKENPVGRRFVAYANLTIGLSYFHDKTSSNKAIEYLQKSVDIYLEIEEHDIAMTILEKIDFIKIFHGIDISFDTIKHQQNKALWLILNNKQTDGLKILNDLDISKGKNPLREYIKGLATNDVTYFWESLITYINERGDRLYGILPRDQLLKLGEREIAINGYYDTKKVGGRGV